MHVFDLIPPATVADEERRQLEFALRPAAMAGPLAAALRGAGEVPASGRPACHILDVRYEPGARCTILYEVGKLLALGTLAWGAARERVAEAGNGIAPLGMRIHLFPDDPAMPGLAAAMRSEELITALTDALPECYEGEWRIARARVTPVRYRPGRRCTLRLELWARHAATGAPRSWTLFGKVYHSTEKARAVFEHMRMLSEVAPPGAGRLVVARVAGFLPDLPMVLQEPLPGVALDLFLPLAAAGLTSVHARTRRGVVMAASALAELHRLDLTHPRQRSIDGELRRMADRGRAAAAIAPGLGARMADLAETLSRSMERLSLEGREQRLVHADCKPSQFLIGEMKVGLLDFDHAGMADPALDVGAFMAALRQLACRRRASDMDSGMRGLERSFLDSYCDRADVDADFRRRAVWYQAFALLQKAQRAFARSIWSPVPGALLDEARRCL